MHALVEEIQEIRKSPVKNEIDTRLAEFKAIKQKKSDDWFSELCFCLLAANTSSEMASRIQKKLGYEGFTKAKNEQDIINRLKKSKISFSHEERTLYLRSE